MTPSKQHNVSTARFARCASLALLFLISNLYATELSAPNKRGYAYLEIVLSPEMQPSSIKQTMWRHAAYGIAALASGSTTIFFCHLLAPAFSPVHERATTRANQSQLLGTIMQTQQHLVHTIGTVNVNGESLTDNVKERPGRIAGGLPRDTTLGKKQEILSQVALRNAKRHQIFVSLAALIIGTITYKMCAYFFRPEPWTFCGIWQKFINNWHIHRSLVPDEFVPLGDAWHMRLQAEGSITLPEKDAQAIIEKIIMRCMDVRLRE